MTRQTKRSKKIAELIDKDKAYSLEEAVSLLKKVPRIKFDESVDLSFFLNADSKQADQMVRGTVLLPHGTGKSIKVLVLCKGEGVNDAKEAGADYVGGQDLIDKISSGWIDFDVVVAAPDMMRDVGKLGRFLGPRGLMPNPKIGTVTNDLARAVKDAKAGRIEFKLDKQGGINTSIGKISFEEASICENAKSIINAIQRSRPSGVKGALVKNIVLSTTMGPGIKLDIEKLGTA